MPDTIHDDVLDAALAVIETAADRLFVTAGEPAGYADASTTLALASSALTPASFSRTDGDTGGRRLTVAQQASLSVAADGTASHVVLADSGGQRLLLVRGVTPQALVTGNTVTVPSFSLTIEDPA